MPRSAIDEFMDVLHGASRGMSANVLGAPADLAAQVMTVPRYLGASTPDFTEYPFLGSKNIGDGLERIGLLRPPTGTPDERAGMLLGGLLASPRAVGGTARMADELWKEMLRLK